MRTVICHHNDADGDCGAAVLLGAYPEATCVRVRYGDPPPLDLAAGAAVIVVDFCWPPAELTALAAVAEDVTVLDHHATAWPWLFPGEGGPPRARVVAAVSPGAVSAIFDPAQAGCGLAWGYVRPGLPPWPVRYVEDRDLWRWALPDSREVNAYLATLPPGPAAFVDLMDGDRAEPPLEVITAGRAVLALQVRVAQAAAAAAHERELAPGVVGRVVNATAFTSEVGPAVLDRYPEVAVAAIYRVDGAGRECWSLRGRPGTDTARQLAEAHGGGGHPTAAGCETPRGATGWAP